MDSHNDPPEMDFMADSCSMKPIEDTNSTESQTKHPNTPPQLSPHACPSSSSASSVVTPKKTSKRLAKELTPCRMLLDELEEQEESWPFLLPVNTKQFPTYRKIIRWPMDLSTIKKKLIDGQYKSREDFCSDVRLIFNNCEIFNEDDSPVGKAGHGMRTYFETRWGEINGHAHKGSPHSNLSPSR